jgi:hypothetical protein
MGRPLDEPGTHRRRSAHPAATRVQRVLLPARATFDDPDILRHPTEDILSRFTAGGASRKLVWYGFMLTAILLAPLAVLIGQVLARDNLAIVPARP